MEPDRSSGPSLDEVDLSELQGTLIAVVATDRNGQIASYSNRCGVAALWCLAAPGGEIVQPGDDPTKVAIPSTYPQQTYENLQGTSMAAPVVSGGAAVLRQAFPYMTARQIIEIVLTTADDMGSPEIYGHGMFNLGRAVDGPAEFGSAGFASVFDVDTKGHDSLWRGDIVGVGGLIKRGAGTLGLLGTNTYAGGTSVMGGTLMVGGSLSSDVMVATTGRLVGYGTVGADLDVEGMVQPGNGMTTATLTVGGDLRLAQSSQYAVAVQGEKQDSLSVGGSAYLEGGTLSVDLGGDPTALLQVMDVITTSSGVSGTFGSLSTNSQSHFLDPRLTYGNAVTLSFERNAATFESVAGSGNAAALARALDMGGAGSPVSSMLSTQSASGAASGLTQLSGELHSAGAAVLMDQSRHLNGAAQTRIRAAFSSAPAPMIMSYGPDGVMPIAANETEGLAVWAQGVAGAGRIGGDGRASTINRSVGGIALGADYGVLPNARLGALVGYGRSRFDTGSTSEGTADHLDIAIYGGAHMGNVKLGGGLGYGLHGIETSRSIAIGAFTDQLNASYKAHSFQAYGDIGYDIKLGLGTLQPFASLAHTRLHSQGFTERGGIAALSVGSATHAATWTTLGARVSVPMPSPASWGNAAISLVGMAGWRHGIGDIAPGTNMALAGVPGFTTYAASAAKNAAVVELGVDVALDSMSSIGLSYSGVLARRTHDSSVSISALRRF